MIKSIGYSAGESYYCRGFFGLPREHLWEVYYEQNDKKEITRLKNTCKRCGLTLEVWGENNLNYSAIGKEE